jgi:hypothetical protein
MILLITTMLSRLILWLGERKIREGVGGDSVA